MNPRDIAEEGRRGRMVNPRDIAEEGRRGRMVNPRDIAGKAEEEGAAPSNLTAEQSLHTM